MGECKEHLKRKAEEAVANGEGAEKAESESMDGKIRELRRKLKSGKTEKAQADLSNPPPHHAPAAGFWIH